MNNFMYNTPTKVFFGKGVTENIGAYLKDYGAKKVLVNYGGGSAVRSGLIPRIVKQLDDCGVAHIELGGVEPNPKVAYVREASELCRAEGIDFILAVGGGSVIDSAKCTAFSAKCGADPWDIITQKVKVSDHIPVGVVLTIAAAGSEMSNSEVITNPELGLKQGLGSEESRPVVAFMDPELTYTVSKYQTGCGIVDMMMHTMERYYTEGQTGTELTDGIAEALLLAVKNAGAVVIDDPTNYDARATLMWASSLSHNGLTSCGKNFNGLVVHKLEHGLSGVFDRIAHGAGLSVLYPAWAKYVYKYDIPRFSRMAEKVWGVPMDEECPELTAIAGIEAMKEYYHSIGMPVTLAELEVYPEDYEKVADNITKNGTISVASYVPLDKAAIMEIFRLAE